jgi:hypothetical protein
LRRPRRFGPVDDPEIEARRQHILKVLLEQDPKAQQQLRNEGRLTQARATLRRVLARQQLSPSREEDARIEACIDLATLELWLDRAITATTVAAAIG